MQARPGSDRPILPDKLKARLYPAVLTLFARYDFHKVNIREISRKSKISSGTIYKYFASKEDLIFTILDEEIAGISQAIAQHIAGLSSIREIFRKVFWVTMDHYDRNPGLAVTAFITVPMRTWMQDASYRRRDDLSVLKECIRRAAREGSIDPDMTFARIADAYYMICHRYIHNWYYGEMAWKLTQQFDAYFDLFWKMVRPDVKE